MEGSISYCILPPSLTVESSLLPTLSIPYHVKLSKLWVSEQPSQLWLYLLHHLYWLLTVFISDTLTGWGQINQVTMYTLVSHKLWITDLFPLEKVVWVPWNQWIKWCAKDTNLQLDPKQLLACHSYKDVCYWCYLLSFSRQEVHQLNGYGAFWIWIVYECQPCCFYGGHVSQTLASK